MLSKSRCWIYPGVCQAGDKLGLGSQDSGGTGIGDPKGTSV